MKKTYLFPILFLLIVSACKDQNQHQKIAPDELEGPAQRLDEEDLRQLNEAKGKEIVPVSTERFFEYFSIQQNELGVFNFWSMKCKPCLEQIKMLDDVYQELDRPFNLMHIALGDENEQKNIQNFVRQNGIQGQVIATDLDLEDFKKINDSWKGNLPALLIWNKQEDLNLFYDNRFNKDELIAIIETVTL